MTIHEKSFKAKDDSWKKNITRSEPYEDKLGIERYRYTCDRCYFESGIVKQTHTAPVGKRQCMDKGYNHLKNFHPTIFNINDNQQQISFIRNNTPLLLKSPWPCANGRQHNNHPTNMNYEDNTLLMFIDLNISFININSRYCNAPAKSVLTTTHPISEKRLKTTILDRVFQSKIEFVNVQIADADWVTLFCDAWTAPGRGSLRYINAVVLIHKKGFQDQYFFYDSEPIHNHESENGELIFKFLKKQVDKIGIPKVVAISSDNAGVMGSGYRKLHAINGYEDIMFYTCASHAINNFSKIVVNGVRRKIRNSDPERFEWKCAHFRETFETVRKIAQALQAQEFHSFLLSKGIRDLKAPAYSEIRWTSSSGIVKFVFTHFDLILEYFVHIKHPLESKFKSPEFKTLLGDMHMLLQYNVMHIEALEKEKAYIGEAYSRLVDIEWNIRCKLGLKYPGLLRYFDELWSRCYSDCSAIGLLLDPIELKIILTSTHPDYKKYEHNMHANMPGIEAAMFEIFGISAEEWYEYKTCINEFKIPFEDYLLTNRAVIYYLFRNLE